jgi:hypothetical protein
VGCAQTGLTRRAPSRDGPNRWTSTVFALLGLATVDAGEVICMRAVSGQQGSDVGALQLRAHTGRAFEIKTSVSHIHCTSRERAMMIRVAGYPSAPIWMYQLN